MLNNYQITIIQEESVPLAATPIQAESYIVLFLVFVGIVAIGAGLWFSRMRKKHELQIEQEQRILDGM